MSSEDIHKLLNKCSVFQLDCRNVNTKAIQNLLINYSRYTAESSARKYQEEKFFLESHEIQRWYQEKIKNRSKTGERFNVFSALWLDRKENYHSRFIAYLLDPRGHHDQGCRFLNAFLDEIRLDGVDKSMIANVSVIAEYYIGELGRIDIVIKVPHALIAIENKVDAGEGDEQILRYRKWLDGFKHNKVNYTKKLVFLTPEGRDPKSGSPKDVDKLLSYGDIDRILDSVKKGLPQPVMAVLEQYISICKSIHTGDCFMSKIDDEKSYDLLTQGNQLEVALEIATKLDQVVKKRIKNDFVNNVKEIIKGKIADAKIADWDVSGKGDDLTVG